MLSDRSLMYNLQVLPVDMLWSPRANQIHYLDAIEHVCEPDVEVFVDNFNIQITEPDCERI